MVKRIICVISAILLIICGGMPPAALAADDFTVTVPNSPANYMDVTAAGFSLTIKNNEAAAKAFRINYNFDNGYSGSTSIIVPSRGESKANVKFQDPPLGVFDLNISVVRNNAQVYSNTLRICVTRLYEKQFMDEYSRVSFATHMIFTGESGTTGSDIKEMRDIGILRNRDEIYWNTVEWPQNNWNYRLPDGFMQTLADKGMNTFIIVDYSNTNYVTSVDGGETTNTTAPRTYEELEAFCRYVKNILRRYPQIKEIEIWNEPNWGFWKPEPNGIDYAAMVKAVSLAAREEAPDIYIMAGSLVHDMIDSYVSDMLDEGILPYIDALSFHTYLYPKDADTSLRDRYDETLALFDAYGGLKDVAATENGIPTHTGSSGSTEEQQAVNMLKHFVYGDEYGLELTNWYNFNNKGADPNDNEHNFGIVNLDRSPKLALGAAAQYSLRMNGSIYIGRLNAGDGIEAHMYMKDGAPLMVAWAVDGDRTLPYGCSYTEDMYGNRSDAANGVQLGKAPVYVYGTDGALFTDAVKARTEHILNNISDISAVRAAERLLPDIREKTAALGAGTDIQTAYGIITELKAAAEDAVRNGNGVYSAAQIKTVNVIRKLIWEYSKLYAVLGGSADTAETTAEYENTANMLEQRKENSYSVSELGGELLRHMKKNIDRAQKISSLDGNDGKTAAVCMYTTYASALAGAARICAQSEKLNNYAGVLLYPSVSKLAVTQENNGDFALTVHNGQPEALNNVYAVLKDEKGRELYASESVNVASGGSTVIDMHTILKDGTAGGKHKFSIELMSEGSVISKRGIYADVQHEYREYDVFGALDFEDASKLSVRDRKGAVEFITNGTDNFTVYEGNTSLYVNGAGSVRVSASADTEGKTSLPQPGDLIRGTYAVKVMESVPTDWKQPIIHLYGTDETGTKNDLCVTKDLNTYSIWALPRFKWCVLELESTGIPYRKGMQLVCEITNGINQNGGLKFMLDDIRFGTYGDSYDDDLETVSAPPEVEEYTDFNSSFENTTDGTFPSGWGLYVPHQDTDNGPDGFIYERGVQAPDGNAMLKIVRGSSAWNIQRNISKYAGDLIGGSYKLYVSEDADLRHNFPYVYVECVVNGETYTVASSPKNIKEYPLVKGAWNTVPIVPTEGMTVPPGAERVNLMIASPAVINGDVGNEMYAAPFLLDDIRIGEVKKDIYINNASSTCRNGQRLDYSVIVSSAKDYTATDAALVTAVYENGRLSGVRSENITLRGKGYTGFQSMVWNGGFDIVNSEAEAVFKAFLMKSDGSLTPIGNSIEIR